MLEPLVAELGTSRQRIEALARENGKLTAELERAASGMVALGDELEAVKARQTTPQPDLTPQPAEPTG